MINKVNPFRTILSVFFIVVTGWFLGIAGRLDKPTTKDIVKARSEK